MTDSEWLFFLPTASLENLRSAGLAITPTDAGYWHAGMLHRAEGEDPNLLDLANDHWLRNLPPNHKYAWVQLNLPAARLLSVAAMCRLIAKRHASPAGGLPYAFRYKETVFSADGRLLLGKTEYGLTCATFILAVLKSVSIELLNLTEWPLRDGDVDRHRELLAMLSRDTRIAKDHIDAVTPEVNCVRYRPEEVVGAASLERFPVSFLDAQAAARQIISAFARRATTSTP